MEHFLLVHVGGLSRISYVGDGSGDANGIWLLRNWGSEYANNGAFRGVGAFDNE